MKKLLLSFIITVFVAQSAAVALTVVKAPTVTAQKTSPQTAGASLIPTVTNLISGVQALSQKQKALTGECVPTSSEISWVNNMIKEWAKTGAMTAEEAEKAMPMERCTDGPTGGYEESARLAADTDDIDFLCFDYFGGSSDKGTVWENFPMASKGYYCTDGSVGRCSEKNKKEVSNIYDVFNLIEFTEKDYTEEEYSMASKLMAKIENCSNAKISAKKRALWGEFLNSTIGSLGQKTNSANIMDVVQSVAGSVGGGNGGFNLQSLSGVAGQLFQQ